LLDRINQVLLHLNNILVSINDVQLKTNAIEKEEANHQTESNKTADIIDESSEEMRERLSDFENGDNNLVPREA
jgi:hypothetical protein